jgi:hypothetical protein
MPNRLSWTTGFDARRGGEPQNSGGCGDAADRPLSSPCRRTFGQKNVSSLYALLEKHRGNPGRDRPRRQKDPTFERRRSSRSMPASENPPLWWHRRGATGRRGLGQKSGLLASPAAAAGAATARGLFMAAAK